MTTRVLVTGAAGAVGRDLLDVLAGLTPPAGHPDFQPDAQPVGADEFAVMGLTHHDLDLTDTAALARCVASTAPDVIVNLAAYTAVDKAESDIETAFAVNDVAVGALSDAAALAGAHFITVSTDYVFNGRASVPYREDDQPDPTGVYGASKWAGEQRCRPTDTVVRTSWVVGTRGRSVVHLMIDRARTGQQVRFVNDQRGTYTAAPDLARALASLVRTRPGGVWHVANSGVTTWFDIAAEVGRLSGRGGDFATAIATSDLDPQPPAARPAFSALDTSKFAASYAALPDWRDALSRLVRDWRPS